MAKKAQATSAAKSNGYDGDQLRALIGKLEGYEQDLLSEQGAYMNRCRAIRDSIKITFTEAKAAGIPKKILAGHVALRKLERKKEAVVESLQDEEGLAEAFDMTASALGDFAALPLGIAAVHRAAARVRQRIEKQSGADAAIDSLAAEEDDDFRPGFLRDAHASAPA
jgi:uncharacterized protein (UPF0335 family)